VSERLVNVYKLRLVAARIYWDSSITYPSNTVRWLLKQLYSHFWHSDRRYVRLGKPRVCGNGRQYTMNFLGPSFLGPVWCIGLQSIEMKWNEMQSVQRLHSTNSDQRRDNLAEWHGVHTVYLSLTRLSTNRMSHPAFISLAFTRWRRPSKVAHIWISLLLIYWPRKDERLSWPSWLTL